MTNEEKKEKIRIYFRAYYKKNRDKILARCRKWQAENQEYVKTYRKAYALTHARKLRAVTAKWRKENAEYNRLYNRLRYAKLVALEKGDMKKADLLTAELKGMIETRKLIKRKGK